MNDTPTTRHHEYSGRYEYIRQMMADHAKIGKSTPESQMQGQCALILLDLLEETAQMRAELAQLNATNLELIVHRTVK